MQTKTTGCMNI